MEQLLVSIHVVVYNGSRFIRRCLDAVARQTYPNCEVVILDNASTDDTREIIARQWSRYTLIAGKNNVGMWPGQEELLRRTRGVYVLALSVDVILDPDFITAAVRACEHDPSVAAVQGKLYRYSSENWNLTTSVIDTCGFAITRGRKVLNVGHGQPDGPAFSAMRDIFGTEGAAPFFRRSALEACRVEGRIWDPDYFWYGDDLDLAWRMTLFGHHQVFVPSAVAWHDRSTTKGVATGLREHVERLALRRAIPIGKRRLDWANVRFTIIKNDYIINLLRDAPAILLREVATLAYTIAVEPGVLMAVSRFLRLFPSMIRRRRLIMARVVATSEQMREWFTQS